MFYPVVKSAQNIHRMGKKLKFFSACLKSKDQRGKWDLANRG